MRRFLRPIALALAVTVAGLGSCVPPPIPYDRGTMLRETAEIVILPGYEAVEADAAALASASHALCASPSLAGLTEAQAAWRVAFVDWQSTLAYQFGPTRDANLGPEMAFWPTRPIAIEANVAGATEITPAWIDALGAGGKGLYAIEYLLYGTADDAAALAQLESPRRCAYLAALADHVARTSARIVLAWSPEGGDYLGALATAGEPGNEVFLAQLAAVSTVITQVLTQLRIVKLTKLGIPLGRIDGLPQPGSIETLYAEHSVEGMVANLEGARRLWSAAPHSLDGYLRSRRPDLADTVLAQFDATIAAFSVLPEPFGAYVSGADHAAGDASYERIRELERAIGNDVSTALAVSVMFTDNDGD
jgi:uncharacterized protein